MLTYIWNLYLSLPWHGFKHFKLYIFMLNSDKTTVYNVGVRKRNFSSSELHTCHLFATQTRIKLFNAKERKLQHLITSASLTKFRHIQSQYYFCKVPVLSGADEKEHATPILSLCHRIFTDWSIFSIPFLLWKKGSSGPVTSFSFLWLVIVLPWESHFREIQSKNRVAY